MNNFNIHLLTFYRQKSLIQLNFITYTLFLSHETNVCIFFTTDLFNHQYYLSISLSPYLLITVHNVVAARLCFHRCLSFCSQGGGLYPSMHWADPPGQKYPLGRNTPWAGTPPGRHPPGQIPLIQCMLGYTHTLPSACWDTHTPANCMLGYTPPPGGYCSGWYISYWNVFLSRKNFAPPLRLQTSATNSG